MNLMRQAVRYIPTLLLSILLAVGADASRRARRWRWTGAAS